MQSVGLLSAGKRALYFARKYSVFIPSSIAQRAIRTASKNAFEVEQHTLEALNARLRSLLTADWANAQAGYYPEAWLFKTSLREMLDAAPKLLKDLPSILNRRKTHRWDAVPDSAKNYPKYYQRTFHWQTDGYFSERSASVYDLSVEFLFGGTADTMRRQAMVKVLDYLDSPDNRTTNAKEPEAQTRGPQILDVACGNGRFIDQLKTLSDARGHRADFFGVDISDAYIGYANKHRNPHIQFTAANAEKLPYADQSMDVVTSVFLFHELPRQVRRQVMSEIARVLKPGGLLVVEDSAQKVESTDIEPVLTRFPIEFHEPYYPDYIKDPFEDWVSGVGFESVTTERCFVAKIVTATRGASGVDA